jgi:hypothetical protein
MKRVYSFADMADKSVSSFHGWWLLGIKRLSVSFNYSVYSIDGCFCPCFVSTLALLDRSSIGHLNPSESLTVDEHFVFMDEKAS